MVNYPLTSCEETTIRWVIRIAPAVAMTVVTLLGAISAVSAQG